MKKLKLNDPSDLGQFFGILIIIGIVATFGVACLEKLFGIVPVFFTFVTIIIIAGIYVILLQIREWQNNKNKL